jgi:hypothetical protein
MNSKYEQLLTQAFAPENKLTIYNNGWGLITGPSFTQGLWVSYAIIGQWKNEGWL